MPKRNRVTPQGLIEAVTARGTMMGNRGILHDEAGMIGRRRWTHKRWVTCLLAFEGRRRALMQPGHYTELFFLDEAVALAAGHRPCKECRRQDFDAYAAAWRKAHGGRTLPKADEIDTVLHAHRIGLDRRPASYDATLGELPDGCFVAVFDAAGECWLLWQGRLHRWTHDGYAGTRAVDLAAVVAVLTPRASVASLRAGYRPGVHGSAG